MARCRLTEAEGRRGLMAVLKGAGKGDTIAVDTEELREHCQREADEAWADKALTFVVATERH